MYARVVYVCTYVCTLERFHSCLRLPERNSYTRTAVSFFLWRMLRTNISTSWLYQSNKSLVLCCEVNNGKCLLNTCTQFYSFSQASAGSKFIKQQGPQQKWWNSPCLMFQTLSLCMCCSLHVSFKYDNTLILGILSVTVHVFYVPKMVRTV
jgi:hypothetical protein